ncbi:hypothetical protein AMELA_G00037770 [Ameiurus melas]|uniref:Uncharacterized protein n=1 Tax=Ameiurus melas TaxID=219545 RepID=A0A7J6B8Z6_AMEME|nr:hypothetical protein AMELA_G00037770 [Ameiurus melas]
MQNEFIAITIYCCIIQNCRVGSRECGPKTKKGENFFPEEEEPAGSEVLCRKEECKIRAGLWGLKEVCLRRDHWIVVQALQEKERPKERKRKCTMC